MTTNKRLFIPLTKYDAEKGIAYGVAASSTLDRSNEIFDYAGSKPYFEKWSANAIKATAGKSMGNLRSMHGNVAAGKIETLAFNDDDELIEVAAKVVDANEQKKCEEGVYTGFSLGGKYIKKWKDGDATRYIADPYEISLVDLPCIPDATFEYVKGATAEVRKFHVAEADGPVTTEPTNDEIATKAQELAKAVNKTDWLSFIDPARAALTKAVPAVDGDLEPQNVLDLAVTAVDEAVVEKNEDLGAEQVWTHKRLPGQTFGKKAELRTALDALDAEEAAAKLAAPAREAAKALTAVLDDKDPAGVRKNKSDNPDDATAGGDGDTPANGKGGKAKPGAKPAAATDTRTKAKDETDKSKPMKSAVDVIARAKVCCAEDVPSFTERRAILKAAMQFDALSALPEGFIDVPVDLGDLAKSAGEAVAKAANLSSVSGLISLVGDLECFHTRISSAVIDGYYSYYNEAMTKIDVSPALMQKVSDMVDGLGEVAAELLDEVLAAMKSEEAQKAVARGTALGDLRKIGARNSTKDKDRLKKAHDLLAEIEPAMCAHDDADKLSEGDLKKAMTAQQDAFTKTISELTDVLKDTAERVKRIEAQPLPGRPSSLTVIEKDAGGILRGDDGVNAANDRANRAAFAEMNGDFLRLSTPRQ
jgi:hypothetical protein